MYYLTTKLTRVHRRQLSLPLLGTSLDLGHNCDSTIKGFCLTAGRQLLEGNPLCNKLTFSHKFPLFGCSVRRANGQMTFSFFCFSCNYPKFSTHGMGLPTNIFPPTFSHKHFTTKNHRPSSSLANCEPTSSNINININRSIDHGLLHPPPLLACSSIMAVIVDDRPSWPRNTSLPTPDPQLSSQRSPQIPTKPHISPQIPTFSHKSPQILANPTKKLWGDFGISGKN
jgi:hypothetical protein